MDVKALASKEYGSLKGKLETDDGCGWFSDVTHNFGTEVYKFWSWSLILFSAQSRVSLMRSMKKLNVGVLFSANGNVECSVAPDIPGAGTNSKSVGAFSNRPLLCRHIPIAYISSSQAEGDIA